MIQSVKRFSCIRCVLAIVAIAGLSANAKEDDTLDEALKLNALTHTPQQKKIEELSTERRAELAKAIKKYSEGLPARQFDYILVHLGDEETIRALELAMTAGDDEQFNWATHIFSSCNDLRVIEHIAPALFYVEDDQVGCPRKVQAKMAIAEVFRRTPGLKQEVYKWFDDIAQALPYHQIPVVQAWWKANEVHFRKRDFLAVKPGEVPPPAELVEVYRGADGKMGARLRPGAVWPQSPR